MRPAVPPILVSRGGVIFSPWVTTNSGFLSLRLAGGESIYLLYLLYLVGPVGSVAPTIWLWIPPSGCRFGK
jgi:hypothetical protein